MTRDCQSLEGLGAPSQKTSLLGGVAQILICKTIPTSSRCGTICSTQIPTIPPSNKESPCKLNYLHTGRSNAPSRSNSLLRGKTTRLMWSNNCCRSLFYTAWELARPLQRSTAVKFLKSPILASQGPIVPFCASGVGRLIAPFAPLGDLHRRTSPTHTTKFGAWLWYHLKDSGHHPKRLSF